MDHDLDVDACGLLCPLPVLRAGRALRGLRPGQVLRISATDRMALIDMPHFAREAGHELLGDMHEGEVMTWWLRRGPDPEHAAADEDV